MEVRPLRGPSGGHWNSGPSSLALLPGFQELGSLLHHILLPGGFVTAESKGVEPVDGGLKP